MVDLQPADITEFWNWFISNKDELPSVKPESELFQQLDARIRRWGFGWEIGPGLKKAHSFTISPNGNEQGMNTTKAIIDEAPKWADWEFYYAKQAKENWNQATIYDPDIKIDAAAWTYVLLQYPDNKVELLLKAANVKPLSQELQETVTDLILTICWGRNLKLGTSTLLSWFPSFRGGKKG